MRHIERLVAAGWKQQAIAEAANVGVATISEIRRGHYLRVKASNAAAIRGVKGKPRGMTVPAAGTMRRLQALAWLGWSMRQVCREAGLCERYGAQLVSKDRATVDLFAADAIAAVYDRLSMTPAPATARHNQVRAVARARGWLPPMTWDDIDDIHERPTNPKPQTAQQDAVDEAVVLRVMAGEPRPRKLTHAEATLVAKGLLARGFSPARIENDYGLKPERYLGGVA
jgi:hypothetical protein